MVEAEGLEEEVPPEAAEAGNKQFNLVNNVSSFENSIIKSDPTAPRGFYRLSNTWTKLVGRPCASVPFAR